RKIRWRSIKARVVDSRMNHQSEAVDPDRACAFPLQQKVISHEMKGSLNELHHTITFRAPTAAIVHKGIKRHCAPVQIQTRTNPKCRAAVGDQAAAPSQGRKAALCVTNVVLSGTHLPSSDCTERFQV